MSEAHEKIMGRMQDEIERLRAHLEAEQGVIAKFRAAMTELRAERDALRAELIEAHEMLVNQARTIKRYQDTALKGDGDEME